MRVRPGHLNTAIAVPVHGGVGVLRGRVRSRPTSTPSGESSTASPISSARSSSPQRRFCSSYRPKVQPMTEVDEVGQQCAARRCRLWRWLPHDRNWLAG